jgi:copper(I)-binding protein
MRNLPLTVLPLLLFLTAAGDPPQIQIDHPWARASAGAAKTGAAYLTITDQGQPDQLTGASTPVAASAELHESMDDMGMMKMRPMAALALPPGKPVTLGPGGYHLMLMGLKAPLKAGDTFPLTLQFAHAPPQTVTVAVEPIGAKH